MPSGDLKKMFYHESMTMNNILENLGLNEK
jgi:hypothetical protein